MVRIQQHVDGISLHTTASIVGFRSRKVDHVVGEYVDAAVHSTLHVRISLKAVLNGLIDLIHALPEPAAKRSALSMRIRRRTRHDCKDPYQSQPTA